MSDKIKDQKAILQKLGIEQLNEMQQEAQKAIRANKEIVLLSPTGTGKTLAFLLPIIEELDRELNEIQVLILVPSRELAIQIEQVTREMGSGFKAVAVYGGRAGGKERIELKHPPAILIGTPGRIADHIRRENIITDYIEILVLDEFDKSLEVGFQKEMEEIMHELPSLKKKILTSATQKIDIPKFVGVKDPEKLNFLGEAIKQLQLKVVYSHQKNRLKTLAKLLGHVGNGSGIIFCNFKDTIQGVSDFLTKKGITHDCFYGGLEQIDRERALIKFRNGTHRFLIATDLAARGIDVPELDFIIHYELPPRAEEFTHRNGRTARMNSNGTAFIMRNEDLDLPDFIVGAEVEKITVAEMPSESNWETLYISGGRKDKISKGDIAGLFFKQGGLEKNELGIIELKQDCAFVSVSRRKTHGLIKKLNNTKLKKKKVRISILD